MSVKSDSFSAKDLTKKSVEGVPSALHMSNLTNFPSKCGNEFSAQCFKAEIQDPLSPHYSKGMPNFLMFNIHDTQAYITRSINLPTLLNTDDWNWYIVHQRDFLVNYITQNVTTDCSLNYTFSTGYFCTSNCSEFQTE